MKSLIGLILFGVILGATTVRACPLGAKEGHLTIQRVMLNFGKYVSDADQIAYKGIIPYEKVEDSEIKTAIEKLGLAISCAEAVLKDPTGDRLPSEIYFIKDEAAKKEYINDFIYFMDDFKDGLIEYRDVLSQVLAQKPKLRDFQMVMEKTKDMNRRVDRAHSKL